MLVKACGKLSWVTIAGAVFISCGAVYLSLSHPVAIITMAAKSSVLL